MIPKVMMNDKSIQKNMRKQNLAGVYCQERNSFTFLDYVFTWVAITDFLDTRKVNCCCEFISPPSGNKMNHTEYFFSNKSFTLNQFPKLILIDGRPCN